MLQNVNGGGVKHVYIQLPPNWGLLEALNVKIINTTVSFKKNLWKPYFVK